jgi:hypothetical protein
MRLFAWLLHRYVVDTGQTIHWRTYQKATLANLFFEYISKLQHYSQSKKRLSIKSLLSQDHCRLAVPMPNNPRWITEHGICKTCLSSHRIQRLDSGRDFLLQVYSPGQTQGAAVGPECLTTSMARSDEFTEECRTSGRVLM